MELLLWLAQETRAQSIVVDHEKANWECTLVLGVEWGFFVDGGNRVSLKFDNEVELESERWGDFQSARSPAAAVITQAVWVITRLATQLFAFKLLESREWIEGSSKSPFKTEKEF